MSEEQKNMSEEQEKMKEVAQLICNGASFKDLKGITDQQMDTIYAMGYNFYNSGRLDDADKIFRFLVLFDHLNQKYWLAIAAVCQVQRQFDRARVAYEFAAMLNLKNPKPIYHAAECYLALGRVEDAEATLNTLKEQCPPTNEENRTYLELGKQLEKLVEKIKKEKK